MSIEPDTSGSGAGFTDPAAAPDAAGRSRTLAERLGQLRATHDQENTSFVELLSDMRSSVKAQLGSIEARVTENKAYAEETATNTAEHYTVIEAEVSACRKEVADLTSAISEVNDLIRGLRDTLDGLCRTREDDADRAAAGAARLLDDLRAELNQLRTQITTDIDDTIVEAASILLGLVTSS